MLLGVTAAEDTRIKKRIYGREARMTLVLLSGDKNYKITRRFIYLD